MRIVDMSSHGVCITFFHSGLAQSITTFITRNSLETIRAASDGGITYWRQNLGQKPPRRGEIAGWREKGKRYNERKTGQEQVRRTSKVDIVRPSVAALIP